MRTTRAATIILSIAIAVIASLIIPNASAAQTDCTQLLTASATEGSWTDDCPAQNRNDAYARFYTFSVSQDTEVTITLESETDPYLFLLDDARNVVEENDDIDKDNRDFNSRITRTLGAGDYTIEATTYATRATGDFTLTVEGVDFDTPINTQPSPEPTPDDPVSELPECVERLPDDMTVAGAWIASDNCTSSIAASAGDGDRHARFYTFTLDAESYVAIDLSSDVDTFLYLRTDVTTDGNTIADNDDRATGDYDSLIEAQLQPGDYTIEATTYKAGAIGDFTLAVTVTAVSVSPTPTPTPDPGPSPSPDPMPNPTPPECTQSTGSGTVEGAWTSGCVSRSRDDNGVHYARYYTFTLDRQTTVELILESRTDPYLILLDEAGEIVDENDDYGGRYYRNSGLIASLAPGNYTVEATTYAGEAAGEFTLTMSRPELDALQALYDVADGANWTNNDNWFSSEPLSEWYGITTDEDGRVTEIYLIGNNLVGEIPAALGRLSELEGLYLARNELTGSIPPELGDLYNLRVLMLFDNDLTGSIPHQFGNLESMEEIHLGRNRLSGRIPRQLGDMENLRRLHLTVNELDGSIPAELGNLSNLRQLSIAANNLSGSIPVEIADLTELTYLYLWGNDLYGGAFIANLDNLANMQFLDVGGNQIDGATVLSKVSALTELTGLGIHDSGITDADMRRYMNDLASRDLEFLNISSNGLSDPQTLVGLSRITTIQRLAINDNEFGGALPRTFTGLTLMRLLYYYDNDGLCAPADSEFQNWLLGIRDVKGDTCTGGTPAHAPTPATGSVDQFAIILQTPEQIVPPHSLSALAAGQSGG